MSFPSLILGSQSPRRKEILDFFSLPFQQIPSYFDEDSIPFTGDPREYVKQLSKEKARALSLTYPKSLILTADTIVYKSGKVYGKPANEEELFLFLSELQGNWHTVLTSLTLKSENNEHEATEETRVLFNQIPKEYFQLYSNYIPWQDKSGGYMIQSASCLAINRIEGCFYNVMGLPINALQLLFQKFGLNLWNYLEKAEKKEGS